MYVAPDIVRPAASSNTASRSVAKTFYALLCFGVILFLIAATIVLALIPIYSAAKTATLNLNTRKSKLAQLIVSVEANHSGRKRLVGDLSYLIGYSIDNSSFPQIHDQLLPAVKAAGGADLEIISASFGYNNVTVKKRFALARQRRALNIVMTVKFRIIFDSSCYSACQDDRGPGIQQALQNSNSASDIVLTNVVVKIGTTTMTVGRVEFVSIESVSSISSSSSQDSGSQAPGPVVYNSTTTSATTVSATPVVSG